MGNGSVDIEVSANNVRRASNGMADIDVVRYGEYIVIRLMPACAKAWLCTPAGGLTQTCKLACCVLVFALLLVLTAAKASVTHQCPAGCNSVPPGQTQASRHITADLARCDR